MKSLVETAVWEAVRLLKENTTPWGVRASAPSRRAAARNYTSVFARDVAISAFGMVASQERELIETSHRGLLTIGRFQAPNGQIPNFVNPHTQGRDFYYVGCIDATLWWLLAVQYLDTHLRPRGRLRRRLARPIRRALLWLQAQEHPEFHLLQQNEASDWADLLPRSGFVLSTNALWYAVQRLYGLPRPSATHRFGNALLFPLPTEGASAPLAASPRARTLVAYARRGKPHPYYRSFVNFAFWGNEIDVFGNILACLVGLADGQRTAVVVRTLLRARAHRPFPVRAVIDPIRPGTRLWRPYMRRHHLNLPDQYQNGGVWPFIGGFWVLLLTQIGHRRLAREELARLATANALGGWQFNEWLHGRTGNPTGMRHQSWNAAMFLLAAAVLRNARFGRVLG